MAELTHAALADCRVWVTRPRAQAAVLCELIRAAGGEAVEFPLTEVVPAPDQDAARTALEQVAQYALCIFISRSAVRCALELCPSLGTLFGNCRVLAVGAGTAAELSRYRIEAATGPGPAYGSDDLLTLSQLQADAVRGRNVLIVRGTDGDAKLRNVLAQHGAVVRYAEVYQRRRPDHDMNQIRLRWRQAPPDVIVLTSAEGVSALQELTPGEHRARLMQTPLVVISDRVCAAARSAGFAAAVQVATSAGDAGLYQTLLAWRRH